MPVNKAAAECADILIIKNAVVQKRGQEISLLLRAETCVHIFRAHPSQPSTLRHVPWTAAPKYGSARPLSKQIPTSDEKAYAVYLHKHIDGNALPDIVTFDETVRRSAQASSRPQELKDANVSLYCDLLVQVVAKPLISSSFTKCATLCVSDYTENSRFASKRSSDAGADADGTVSGGGFVGDVGDSNGYLTKYGIDAARANGTGAEINEGYGKWTGPSGRRSMDVVCFTPHADYIQDHVKLGSWVTMERVFIKQTNTSLEGVMYSDANAGSPLRIALVETDDMDLESMDPRYIAALRRKRDLEKACKVAARKRKLLLDARMLDEDKPLNRKQRRLLSHRGLSELTTVTGELCSQPVNPLEVFLQPSHYNNADMGSDLKTPIELPFRNIKIKAQVRVVDFLPKKLADFAVQGRKNEYAILGKDRESSVSTSSEDEEIDSDEGGGDWEWRFALLLEDASQLTDPETDDKGMSGENRTPPARVWAVVDNLQGRTLLNENACDLRIDRQALCALREKMFLLWGNLLEIKLQAERSARAANDAKQKEALRKEAQQAPNEKAKNRLEQARERVAVNNMPLTQYPQPANEDSDDDDNDGPSNASAAKLVAGQQLQQQRKQQIPGCETEKAGERHSSLPFMCGLWQYGVLETVSSDSDIDDGSDSSDGRKKVWRRTCGMFGTMIRE
ncbi:hypothetical protein SEPCBS57363_003527 [Sporothrix epigloea]|uniref:Protection of telomeres protein 1 ssDNA-binding domain-containing protein n=1 Tax=Sporothrix epigloea TaxID=1892477 RepID=A0ABP0DM61_9PEZI